MSNRERWIIYPLLFLSLGASMRTQLVPVFDRLFADNLQVKDVLEGNHIKGNNIQCHTLEVTESILVRDENGKARIVISDASSRSGQIHILGPDGKSAIALGVSQKSGSGVIDVFDTAGKVRVQITSIQDGGGLATFGADEKPLVYVEHDGQGNGTVVRYDAQGHRFGMLGLRLPDPPPPEEAVDPTTTDQVPASEAEPTTKPAAEGESEEADNPAASDSE